QGGQPHMRHFHVRVHHRCVCSKAGHGGSVLARAGSLMPVTLIPPCARRLRLASEDGLNAHQGVTMTSTTQSPHLPTLSNLLRQLHALRQQHPALQPLDPLLQQLDKYCEHFQQSARLICLELSQVSSAMAGLTMMLDQSNPDTLDSEQMYCLLEPLARRLQQTSMQMQELA
ncbi:hypothetical protein C3F00_040210, partial [Pseudomonas sp. MWU13-2860]